VPPQDAPAAAPIGRLSCAAEKGNLPIAHPLGNFRKRVAGLDALSGSG
jgi:hypothetical protein